MQTFSFWCRYRRRVFRDEQSRNHIIEQLTEQMSFCRRLFVYFVLNVILRVKRVEDVLEELAFEFREGA